ncbi:MAG: hypothetical protein ACLT2T_08795 [Bilophila wadsworthia]
MFASFMAATGRNAPLGQAGGHFMHSQQGISLGLISGVAFWPEGFQHTYASIRASAAHCPQWMQVFRKADSGKAPADARSSRSAS